MKIAFTSCMSTTVFAQQPVWDQIAGQHPDRLLLLGVPYIFITGYGQGHLVARHGHAPVLSKPFGAEQLVAALARAGWMAPGD